VFCGRRACFLGRIVHFMEDALELFGCNEIGDAALDERLKNEQAKDAKRVNITLAAMGAGALLGGVGGVLLASSKVVGAIFGVSGGAIAGTGLGYLIQGKLVK
jgi:uncharacterized membrane protein